MNPLMRLRVLSLGAFALACFPLAQAQPRRLMLATAWRPGLDLPSYWVSEKLDGMRAHWDGRRLWSRGGHRIHAPAWFTDGWPEDALDGELWCGHGSFEQTVSTVRQRQPRDEAWQNVRFMVFDLPEHPGPFDERLAALRTLVTQTHALWLQPIAQDRVSSETELQEWLERVLALGGEGLMLHQGSALYRGERSPQLLKLKPWADAEARVIAHLPGKGQHEGRLGALLVEMQSDDGLGTRLFRLGTGLEDRQRLHPPAIGSVVSFRHQGFTASGLPRFASYWRARPED